MANKNSHEAIWSLKDIHPRFGNEIDMNKPKQVGKATSIYTIKKYQMIYQGTFVLYNIEVSRQVTKIIEFWQAELVQFMQ